MYIYNNILMNILFKCSNKGFLKLLLTNSRFHQYKNDDKLYEKYLIRKYGKIDIVDVMQNSDIDGLKYVLKNKIGKDGNIFLRDVIIDYKNKDKMIEIINILFDHSYLIRINMKIKTYKNRQIKKTKIIDKSKYPIIQAKGFSHPVKLSPELYQFIGVSPSTELARTDVTRRIIMYIKNNNLQDLNNRKIILPDTKLNRLLKIPNGEQLTYFNLQKYLKKHFL